MNQLYHIQGWCPTPGMSTAGFQVLLFPAWREAVEHRSLTQEDIYRGLNNMGRIWLDSHGFDGIWDPDNCGFQKDKEKLPGPNARPMYRLNEDLRITWGDWGPEHITVPGNACGLDLSKCIYSPQGGMTLLPHNVDTIKQASLLLTVFLWFADTLYYQTVIEQ